MKLQSAIEFMSTYGFMLLIVSLIIIAIFYFAFPVQSIVQSQCTVFGELNCGFAVYHSNTISGIANVIFYISNSGSAPINVINTNVIINNATYTGNCNPTFINPGASTICSILGPKSQTPGTQVKGYFVITANYCNAPVGQLYPANCTYTKVSYTGQFFTYSTYITANSVSTSSTTTLPKPIPPTALLLLPSQQPIFYGSTGLAEGVATNSKDHADIQYYSCTNCAATTLAKTTTSNIIFYSIGTTPAGIGTYPFWACDTTINQCSTPQSVTIYGEPVVSLQIPSSTVSIPIGLDIPTISESDTPSVPTGDELVLLICSVSSCSTPSMSCTTQGTCTPSSGTTLVVDTYSNYDLSVLPIGSYYVLACDATYQINMQVPDCSGSPQEVTAIPYVAVTLTSPIVPMGGTDTAIASTGEGGDNIELLYCGPTATSCTPSTIDSTGVTSTSINIGTGNTLQPGIYYLEACDTGPVAALTCNTMYTQATVTPPLITLSVASLTVTRGLTDAATATTSVAGDNVQILYCGPASSCTPSSVDSTGVTSTSINIGTRNTLTLGSYTLQACDIGPTASYVCNTIYEPQIAVVAPPTVTLSAPVQYVENSPGGTDVLSATLTNPSSSDQVNVVYCSTTWSGSCTPTIPTCSGSTPSTCSGTQVYPTQNFDFATLPPGVYDVMACDVTYQALSGISDCSAVRGPGEVYWYYSQTDTGGSGTQTASLTLSTTLTSPEYICSGAFAGGGWNPSKDNEISWWNSGNPNFYSGVTNNDGNLADASGTQSSSTCTLPTSTSTKFFGVLGIQNSPSLPLTTIAQYQTVQASNNQGYAYTWPWTVSTSNSFVVIVLTCGVTSTQSSYGCEIVSSLPSGCILQYNEGMSDTDSYMAVCPYEAAGSYSISFLQPINSQGELQVYNLGVP